MELKQECEQVKACMKDTDDLRKTLLKDKKYFLFLLKGGGPIEASYRKNFFNSPQSALLL